MTRMPCCLSAEYLAFNGRRNNCTVQRSLRALTKDGAKDFLESSILCEIQVDLKGDSPIHPNEYISELFCLSLF